MPSAPPKRDPYRHEGRVLGGRYRVEAMLGVGGMGAVYRGTHLVLNTSVAIKILLPHHAADGQTVGRFLQEARAASLLHHPNALTVHDFGHDGPVAYMVTELLTGRSLAHSVGRGCALLPAARLVRVLSQVCDALGAAHAIGIVHRDLKPENIMVENRPTETDFVKVVDFGLARILPLASRPAELERVMDEGTIAGTPEYMSPEQCSGSAITPASDVYALGILLYEMLVGAPPWTGGIFECISAHMLQDPPPVVRPSTAEPVPRGWYDLVATALQKQPARRPANGLEFKRWFVDAYRAMGGQDAVGSPTPSTGREAAYTLASQPPPSAKAPSLGRVVVIGNANGTEFVLRAEGVQVEMTNNEHSARQMPCAAVVVDLGGDVARSVQAVAAFKAGGAGGAVPVLVITADTSIETGRALLGAGADDVLVPPVEGAAVLRRLVRLTRRAR